MYHIKIFPSLKISENASDKDIEFIEALKKVTTECDALYVHFSIFDYSGQNVRSIHFITYPMDWVTHYVRSQYFEHDPVFTTDYRQASTLDWSDFDTIGNARKIWTDHKEMKMGNQGLTLSFPVEMNLLGAASFVYQLDGERWEAFKKSKMDILKSSGEYLSLRYDEVYNRSSRKKHKITKRETECLYWVAMGKTDQEIGEILCIGKWTVVGHLKSAKQKLGCPNRASAVAQAMSIGIIHINSQVYPE
ncbi:MAG: autoinducer binding domain-containing protein [Pseudomonadota bacterium]